MIWSFRTQYSLLQACSPMESVRAKGSSREKIEIEKQAHNLCIYSICRHVDGSANQPRLAQHVLLPPLDPKP